MDKFLITIGGILLLGLLTDYLGKKTFLPRVTLLLVFGILIGDEVLDVIPQNVHDRFELVANIALLMIGFLLGGKLTIASFKESGRQLFWISICASLGTTAIVALALVAIGISVEIAALLGCIAAATAPAATVDAVLESNPKSRFSRLLLAIVAIDDLWALILFSLSLAFLSLVNGNEDGAIYLIGAGREVLGALALGLVIGLPAAYLTGRLDSGQPMLTEALGLVFFCGGMAFWLEVSFLLASMTMGAVIANLAKHHEYPFHEIENIEWPFMILFFILAGASLEIATLTDLGLVGIVYLVARVAGKFLGARLGAQISSAGNEVKQWMGLALLPQAGVAIGMALIAANEFPEHRQFILSLVISSTVFFELIGPIFTRTALRRTH